MKKQYQTVSKEADSKIKIISFRELQRLTVTKVTELLDAQPELAISFNGDLALTVTKYQKAKSVTVKAKIVTVKPEIESPNDLLGDDYQTPEVSQRSSFGSKPKKKNSSGLCPHNAASFNCIKCLMDSKYRAV